jgi:hypothetical protein
MRTYPAEMIESVRISLKENQLSPKQLISMLKRIANDIDKTDKPSRSRVAVELKKLQSRICPVRRMITATEIEVDVTDNNEYDRMMNLLSKIY